MTQLGERPDPIARECGGWIALSPDDFPVHIAVIAAMPDDARVALGTAMERWRQLLGGGSTAAS